MPERSGLTEILDDARAALGRLLLHIRVKEAESIGSGRTHRLEFSCCCRPHSIDYSLNAIGNSQEFLIASTTHRVTAFTDVSEIQVDTDFSVDSAIRDISDTFNAEVISVDCVELRGCIDTVEIIYPLLAAEACTDVRLATPESREVGSIPMKAEHVEEIDPSFYRAPQRGLDTIYNIPMSLHPTPWTSLERSFIVRCWDTLKNGATENLGEDPGKQLEMSAVFNKVDMTHVRRTKYDPAARVLKLWPGDSLMREKRGFRRCAIIIGLLKGTGKVIQVAMPLDNRS